MTLTLAPPDHRKPRCCRQRTPYDPSEIAATIRELAVRAHRLVRAKRAPEGLPRPHFLIALEPSREWNLDEVYSRIVQLEADLHANRLGSLAGYVAALRRQVEDHLV
jgi:hypothetical protein